MAASKRFNLSVPGKLVDIFTQWANATGQTVPAVMVQSLADQVPFVQMKLRRFNLIPRDVVVVGSPEDRVLLSEGKRGVAASGGGAEPVSRQVKRADARRKAKRGG